MDIVRISCPSGVLVMIMSIYNSIGVIGVLDGPVGFNVKLKFVPQSTFHLFDQIIHTLLATRKN